MLWVRAGSVIFATSWYQPGLSLQAQPEQEMQLNTVPTPSLTSERPPSARHGVSIPFGAPNHQLVRSIYAH